MITLQYALTEKDHLQFNYYRLWISPFNRKWRVNLYLRYIFIYGGVILFLPLINDKPITVSYVSIGVILVLVLCLLLPWLSKAKLRKTIHKMLGDPNNARYLGRTELVITDSGVIDRDADSESRYDWKAFRRLEETEDFYYFFLDDLRAITVPKRVFVSEEEKRTFENYIARNISLEIAFESMKKGRTG